MIAPGTRDVSTFALPALRIVADHGTVAAVVDGFAAAGASMPAQQAEALVGELARLGLVRVAGGADDARRFVPTTLGLRALEGSLGGETASSLRELEALRTDLLATIAHELRTPLTAVRTSAGLLLDPASQPTDDQRETLLRTIERNADRMQRIVGDILDLARFRAGRITLQLRRFDAVELARSVVATVGPLADARGQSLEVTHEAHGPRVYGDHRRLEQALLNLVSNAQRFAPDRGRVIIRVAHLDGWVTWAVEDDGPGIPAEDRERLFERFFVGRSDTSGPRSGVGLGLPTALAIAQAHGGTIDVESAPVRGSVFTLRVPEAGPPDGSPGDAG